MNSAKYLTLLISGAMLVACSQDAEQIAAPTPSPAEPAAWIDMPLSENTWWPANREMRTGSYQIVLDAFAGLEFKLGMNAGDIIVYEWDAGDIEPEMLMSEFHGHTERQGDAPGELMFYSNHSNGSENGTLLAPFSGIHGWYLKNNGLEEIVVTLRVAGFYENVEQ